LNSPAPSPKLPPRGSAELENSTSENGSTPCRAPRHLDFSDQELELFTRQLDSILGYIDKLNELDTTRIEPTSHVTRMEQTLREDRTIGSLSVPQALANAPESKDQHFTVPKVIG
jgi:aspartyl-tRNA(Asn)/glutamyl-tRNA(Gln) amidotransferase subunit C